MLLGILSIVDRSITNSASGKIHKYFPNPYASERDFAPFIQSQRDQTKEFPHLFYNIPLGHQKPSPRKHNRLKENTRSQEEQ